MAKAAVKPRRRDFGPLMSAIDQVTKALGKAENRSLRTAIARLTKTKRKYVDVCRFCHVVKPPKKAKK